MQQRQVQVWHIHVFDMRHWHVQDQQHGVLKLLQGQVQDEKHGVY
jgi:hypothetical protein